ncbi:MAG: rRNA pseudouridine synthase [Lentisphaeria bacterium]|nr:rRNA pseudouridine synthase [Lentisphaeria bacterium]
MSQNDESGKNEMALGKYLSTCGVASRRHAVDLVKAGNVTVNGEVELNPARRITENDVVFCNHKKVIPSAKRHYVMLHKPRGYVCTAEDPHAKKKALDLIRHPDHPRLFSAGRLDKDSEGMLIFSDDGDFVNRLTHPSGGIQKIYEVSTDYELLPHEIARLTTGIVDEGERLRALSIRYLYGNKYEFILGEGKNREIRRMLSAVRNRALRLKRVAVGGLSLGTLPCGKWRELTEEEVDSIFNGIQSNSRSASKAAPQAASSLVSGN